MKPGERIPSNTTRRRRLEKGADKKAGGRLGHVPNKIRCQWEQVQEGGMRNKQGGGFFSL